MRHRGTIIYVPTTEPAPHNVFLSHRYEGHEERIREHAARVAQFQRALRAARVCPCGGRRFRQHLRGKPKMVCAECGSRAELPENFETNTRLR